MLALPENNLFVVGDDDQSIYGFRGAVPGILLSFEELYPGAKRVLLDTNYRSAGEIVKSASRLIAHNKERFDKKIAASREEGLPIRVRVFENREREASSLAEFAAAYKKAGGKYGDIAVLYRGVRSVPAFAKAMRDRGIPFQVNGETPDLYEHFIAEDIFAYLEIALRGPDRGNLLKILNKPGRSLDRSALEEENGGWEELLTYYRGRPPMEREVIKMRRDVQGLGRLTPAAAVDYIAGEMGYRRYLREYAALKRVNPGPLLQVLQEMRARAAQFDSLQEWMREAKGQKKRRPIESGGGEGRAREKVRGDLVNFMTMHASKGLEFPVVFIVDVNEGSCPHGKTAFGKERPARDKKLRKDSGHGEIPDSVKQMEEERRVFYVAMTRARDRLYIGYVLEENGRKKVRSRFLDEI